MEYLEDSRHSLANLIWQMKRYHPHYLQGTVFQYKNTHSRVLEQLDSYGDIDQVWKWVSPLIPQWLYMEATLYKLRLLDPSRSGHQAEYARLQDQFGRQYRSFRAGFKDKFRLYYWDIFSGMEGLLGDLTTFPGITTQVKLDQYSLGKRYLEDPEVESILHEIQRDEARALDLGS